jgi:hypothetical protein
MSGSMVSRVAIALLSVGAFAAFGEGGADLVGTWTLEPRDSDDPVRVLNGGGHAEGLGRQVVRGVNIFGFPVGSVVPAEGAADDEEDEGEPDHALRGVEHVFESTYRLTIRQNKDFTVIQYGNAPTVTYRHATQVERDGVVVYADWQNGVFTVEHELANGAHVSERYWVEARSGDLHWTTRLKRPKQGTADVKRVFYRATTTEP